MASLRYISSKVLDDAKDGIAWIAVWKVGRCWCSWVTYDVSCDDAGRLTIEDNFEGVLGRMEDILGWDANAVFLNSYHTNLGDVDEMTVASLAEAIRWQYEECGNRLQNAVECVKYWGQKK